MDKMRGKSKGYAAGDTAVGRKMASVPKATVILLCYNQESKIRRAMESLLRQRCRYPYEILVADDASSDSTRAICGEYAARYPGIVRLMPEHPNKGLIDNYFDAVLAAKGDYVADCAGDDEWGDPDRLQKSVEALDCDESLSVVYTDTILIKENRDGSETESDLIPEHSESRRDSGAGRYAERRSGKEILASVLNHTTSLPYVLSSALYRREPVAIALRENPGILRCHDGGVEDVPLIAYLASRGDAAYIPIAGYRYHIGGESISNNLSAGKDYRFVAGVTSMTRRLGRHYGISPRRQREHFREKFNYMAAQMRRSGDRELIADFRRRCAQWPFRLPLRARVHMLLAWLGYCR